MTIDTPIIPKALIYEEYQGKPIYYKGYKKVLSGQLTTEDITGSSYLQSLIIGEIFSYLRENLDRKKYQILSSELGIHLAPSDNRACDIAIYKKEDLQRITDKKKYLSIPPGIAFEIDLKADLENILPENYYQKKTQQLLDFGVEKLIWISTDPQKVMIATPNAPWLTVNWTDEFEIMEGLPLNLAQLIENA
jgi:Uma2 family endonuclease